MSRERSTVDGNILPMGMEVAMGHPLDDVVVILPGVMGRV
jgi:hypothetical protein